MSSPKIKLDEMKEMACSCGCVRFINKITIREVPAHLLPSGNVEYHPFGIIVCEACGKIYEAPPAPKIIQPEERRIIV